MAASTAIAYGRAAKNEKADICTNTTAGREVYGL